MSKLLRVLYVSTDASSTSGVGRCIADLLVNIDKGAIKPILITGWPSPQEATIIDEVQSFDVPIYHRDLGVWFPPYAKWGVFHLFSLVTGARRRIWALSHLIKKHNIDVVYTNALPTLDAALAARFNGLPHIWHLHEAVCGNQYLKPYLPCFIVKALIRYFSVKIIFVSNDKAHEFGGNGKSNHSCVVHNGVDIRRFSAGVQTSNSLRGELGLAENFRLVVSVGIVSAHKGHDTLIRAAATILKEFPNAAFILVGNELDDFCDRLRKQIVELGIAEHIFFLGPRKDVPAILAQADLLVHPSTQEALPLVLLEAMATGKPVVATRCGGPEEIVVDGETGYLVPVGDEIALADRIKRILSDPESATRMGVAGRKRAEEKFSVEAYARNIQKIIEEVAESSR